MHILAMAQQRPCDGTSYVLLLYGATCRSHVGVGGAMLLIYSGVCNVSAGGVPSSTLNDTLGNTPTHAFVEHPDLDGILPELVFLRYEVARNPLV